MFRKLYVLYPNVADSKYFVKKVNLKGAVRITMFSPFKNLGYFLYGVSNGKYSNFYQLPSASVRWCVRDLFKLYLSVDQFTSLIVREFKRIAVNISNTQKMCYLFTHYRYLYGRKFQFGNVSRLKSSIIFFGFKIS